jgi:hypothetical protein
VRVVAVDWSGRDRGAAESIWLAEVCDGALTRLENGRSRPSLVEHVIRLADNDPEIIVGFDFAFSFPKWWCDRQGWSTAREVWLGMIEDERAERLLDACADPFWGRKGRRCPHTYEHRFRRTEEEDAKGAKSVFQINGGGAVGTGSLRGMPHLHTLTQHGFSIWPFDTMTPPAVIEIYPRAFTERVKKNRWAERHAHMERRFEVQPATMLERAAGSEDAFDAAVSALVMAEHRDAFAQLQATSDPEFRIEGRIWRPEP